MVELRTVRCCATCKHYQGWLDNMVCGRNDSEIRPYFICDYHEQNSMIIETRKRVCKND